jgi:hypothetical protein
MFHTLGRPAMISCALGQEPRKRSGFVPYNCHVLHCDNDATTDRQTDGKHQTPAWASLGMGDLWGMPPIGEHPMKLGCGDLSAPARKELEGRAESTIAERIVERYAEGFPGFKNCVPRQVETKQWVSISTDQPFVQISNCIIVTSDNGAGFKFAPIVAAEICSQLGVNNPYPPSDSLPAV